MQMSDVERPAEVILPREIETGVIVDAHELGADQAPGNTRSADDDAAFEHALGLHKKRELGASFAHRCLTVAIWLGCALILSISVIGYLGYKVANPPIKYFATEKGRVTEVHPTDKPHYSQSDVAAFGADTIRKSFNLDFVHYRDQMTAAEAQYSDLGFQDYYKALVASNLYAAVKEQRLNLSVEVGPGVIRSKGRPGGIYTWEFQYPVTLKLDGQNTSSPVQRYYFTQRIQRVEETVKFSGLEVTQVITTKAN